ncbi:hypothetical protein GEV39_06305 [Pseudomonas sp. NY5710]|nr:hypothetical protein GEV39_06305 [Pseudomonas sp. NY5710]
MIKGRWGCVAAHRRQASSHRYSTSLQVCAAPVGAGLPAISVGAGLPAMGCNAAPAVSQAVPISEQGSHQW